MFITTKPLTLKRSFKINQLYSIQLRMQLLQNSVYINRTCAVFTGMYCMLIRNFLYGFGSFPHRFDSILCCEVVVKHYSAILVFGSGLSLFEYIFKIILLTTH